MPLLARPTVEFSLVSEALKPHALVPWALVPLTRHRSDHPRVWSLSAFLSPHWRRTLLLRPMAVQPHSDQACLHSNCLMSSPLSLPLEFGTLTASASASPLGIGISTTRRGSTRAGRIVSRSICEDTLHGTPLKPIIIAVPCCLSGSNLPTILVRNTPRNVPTRCSTDSSARPSQVLLSHCGSAFLSHSPSLSRP